MEAKKLLIRITWFSFIWMVLFFTGGVATASKIDLAKGTNIKFIRSYQEFTAGEWKKTDIMVQKGEAVIIIPLYPKGFFYSVRGKVGDAGKPFEGLDVDLGDIYAAQTDGFLHFGLDQKGDNVTTGIFIFKTGDLDNILSDLTYIQKNNKDSKMINVTLGLLLKKRADRLLAQNKQTEALPVLDQSIGYLEQADEKLYSRTIYQLYREKALIYKNSHDTDNYADSVNKSYTALIRASEYYRELAKSRFDFMKQLTAEEKFILVTRAGFFEDVRKVDMTHYTSKNYLWGDAPGFDNLAYAYLLLGSYYAQNGNLLLSLKYGEKAIEEARKTGSKDLLGRAFLQLGYRYLSFGFNEEAEKNFKLALDQFSKDSVIPNLAKMALAGLEARQGKFDAAEQRLNTIYFGYAFNYKPMRDLELACVYSMKQEHDRAIKIGNENLNYQSRVTGKNTIDAVTGRFLRILDSYAVKGSAEEANKVFNLMNEYLESNGNPPNLKLRYALALSELNKRFGKDEIAPLEDAIASLEVIRPTAAGGRDYEYWENMLKVYDMTIASMYSKEKYTDALNTVEKARSRRFLDDLGNKKLGAKGSVSLMTQRANETLDALAVLERDMVEAAEKAGIKVRSVYDKDSRLGKKMENYKATLKQASDADQQFGVVTNIVPVSVEKLQKHIPGDTTVVEYYQSKDTLVCLGDRQ
jgi:tetratricopeptide (TPR) repeat protein